MKKYAEFMVVSICTIVCLSLATIYAKDYGVSWDEPLHWGYTKAALEFYQSFFESRSFYNFVTCIIMEEIFIYR
jgi:hypothetical protein